MCFCGYHPGSDIPNSLVLASHVSLIILSRIQEVRVCELINNCEDINPPFHFYEFGPRGGFFRSAVWELEQVKTWGAALPRTRLVDGGGTSGLLGHCTFMNTLPLCLLPWIQPFPFFTHILPEVHRIRLSDRDLTQSRSIPSSRTPSLGFT